MQKGELLNEIKKVVLLQEPDAEIILFGSFVREEQKNDSDIDILILLNKDFVSRKEKEELHKKLYDLELYSNQVISPLIKSKKTWYEKYPNTGLFININKEGLFL